MTRVRNTHECTRGMPSSRDSPTSLIRVFLRCATDATSRFTIGLRALPQEAVPVESQAENLIVQTHGHDKYGRTIADVILLKLNRGRNIPWDLCELDC